MPICFCNVIAIHQCILMSELLSVIKKYRYKTKLLIFCCLNAKQPFFWFLFCLIVAIFTKCKVFLLNTSAYVVSIFAAIVIPLNLSPIKNEKINRLFKVTTWKTLKNSIREVSSHCKLHFDKTNRFINISRWLLTTIQVH